MNEIPCKKEEKEWKKEVKNATSDNIEGQH